MRIEYTCRVRAYDRKGQEISDARALQRLNNYVDRSEDADFTLHMDGALARLGLRGAPLTLVWDATTSELRAAVAFHVHAKPSDEMLRELTDYVQGQVMDGYGEDRIQLPNNVEIELDDQISGPSFVNDGVVVPAPSPDQKLLWAVEDSDLSGVEHALKVGAANANAIGKWNNSVLHAAASRGNASVVAMLLAHGADPNYVNDESFGPLSAAAMTGDVATLTLLLDAGAAPDIVHPKDQNRRMTPLAWTANRGHIEALNVLLARGAAVNAQCAAGNTPLMYADTPAIANILLENGADRTIRDHQGLDASEHHLAQARDKASLDFPGSDLHIEIAALIAK